MEMNFIPFLIIYCQFAEVGQPYEEHVYRLMDRNYVTLTSNDQLSYSDFTNSKLKDA